MPHGAFTLHTADTLTTDSKKTPVRGFRCKPMSATCADTYILKTNYLDHTLVASTEHVRQRTNE